MAERVMKAAPVARVLLRYVFGLFAGYEVGESLAADPDIVNILSNAIVWACAAGMVVVEWLYRKAKKLGWNT